MQQTTFVLQPCKLREDRVVPQKDEPAQTLNWAQLLKRFAANGAHANLQRLRTGYYLGLCTSPRSKVPVSFVIMDATQTGKLRAIDKKDPEFLDRVVEIYRVDEVTWGGGIQEFKS